MKIVGAMLAMLLAAQTATVQQPAEQHDVPVGAGRLHLVVHRGTGPTVLFEAGAGFGADEWAAVIASLAPRSDATLVAYDRAGMGSSDALTTPYDVEEEMSRLHRALYTLGLDRDLVLVGHSFGGFLIQLYANLYPADTRALVYVDSVTVQGLGGVEGAAKLRDTLLAVARERGPKGLDLRMLEGYVPAVETMRRYPAPCGIPVAVMTQGRPPKEKLPDYLSGWRAGHDALVAATGGTLTVATKSGHMVPTDEPALVGDVILATIGKIGSPPRKLTFPAPGATCG